MSLLAASDRSEPRTQAISINNYKDSSGRAMKCRIPQRLPPTSARRPTTSVSVSRAKTFNYADSTKQIYEVMPSSNNRFGTKSSTRPRSDESRPKSAGRLKEELFPNRPTYPSTRFAKPPERVPFIPKKPSTLPRKTAENHKTGRIVVPTQRPPANMHPKNQYCPLHQETNKKYEDLELRLCEISDSKPGSPECYYESEERESITSRNDKVMQLKISWQDKMIQFEQMKNNLKNQQNNLMELYAIMRKIHQQLLSLGEETSLPAAEDLQIMNVAKMTPEQLLQLCADDVIALPDNHHWDGKTPLTIDMNKFYEMPTKLVHTCEQTLAKRKEIIDWFESLITLEKGYSVHKLMKKVNEFNAENDILKSSLELSTSEFLKELDEIVNLMRKGLNKTMTLHLRTEELTYELSELNSQNMDLRKQIHNADHLRSHNNRARVEELEKELKEEKTKRLVQRDRFSRSEGQVKINMERASQLEATLEQARSQIRYLERTVQQLNEQNEKLQSDFDEELNKLTDSIREHTMHLEEIADARGKLQSEKEDLEKRLAELSNYYNESLKNIKQEMNINVAKLIEMEKKYEEQGQDKIRLEERLESLCSQLVETELRHKDTLQQLHAMEAQLEKETEANKELETKKKELEKANSEIASYEAQLSKQNEAMEKIERSLREAVDSMESLKCDVSSKDEYIAEMEKKQAILEEQLQENENKMEAYVEQLSSLKIHINELQEDFGDFENLSDLHEMVNQQRAKLLEATRQNGELAEALQKKDKELEQYNASISEHEKLLLEREDVIKMLSEKEEEQANIVKILRNNLELRSQAEDDLSQQIMEKNIEIDSLVVNLETRKQQISNLEKIILTLEDQTRKASQTRKKDQDCITQLQKKLADSANDNLDSLFKILESEFETTELNPKDHGYYIDSKNKYTGDRKRDKLDNREDIIPQTHYNSEPVTMPTKIIMGNFVQKSYLAGNGEQHSGDNLDRKKANTNIETQKWVSATDPGHNVHASLRTKDNLSNKWTIPRMPRTSFFSRNFPQVSSDQQREDKKNKMFKLAGHKM